MSTREREIYLESRIVSIPPSETLLSYKFESKERERERERVCLRKDRQSFPRPVSNRGKRFVLRSRLEVWRRREVNRLVSFRSHLMEQSFLPFPLLLPLLLLFHLERVSRAGKCSSNAHMFHERSIRGNRCPLEREHWSHYTLGNTKPRRFNRRI